MSLTLPDEFRTLSARLGRDRLQVQGETPRDPVRLLQVARRAAEAIRDENVELEEPMQGAVIAELVVAENLNEECDALAASLEAIKLKESGEKGGISVRQQRIAEFDEFRGDLGRFLERLLELNGMPTLAVTVRPELEGTGRRGLLALAHALLLAPLAVGEHWAAFDGQLPVARQLLTASGLGERDVAWALERAGEHALGTSPERAAELFALAAEQHRVLGAPAQAEALTQRAAEARDLA